MQFLSLAMLTVVSLAVGFAQQPKNTAERIGIPEAKSMSESEANFVQDALNSGRQEVELGQMALRQSSRDQVKEYAQRLVNDHNAANKRLEQIAKEYGIADAVPKSNSPVYKPSSRVEVERLTNLSGPTFDYAFGEQMVRDQEDAVGKFENAQKTVTNADLKAFIDSTLPTLKEHLNQARTLNK